MSLLPLRCWSGSSSPFLAFYVLSLDKVKRGSWLLRREPKLR